MPNLLSRLRGLRPALTRRAFWLWAALITLLRCAVTHFQLAYMWAGGAPLDDELMFRAANAITSDGVMVNIDGNSNRVSCIAQGPRKVIFIVGMNKVCADLDSAMKRARNVAAPINAQRFDIKTPCKETGKCFDCKSPDTICCQFLITRYSRHTDRIHVILVNDTIGY